MIPSKSAWKNREKSSAATAPPITTPRPRPVAISTTASRAAASPTSDNAAKGARRPLGVSACMSSTTTPVMATISAGHAGRRSTGP